jgi:hypothetical protein
LIDVGANRADRLPGFERINEVQLRDYLKQALHEVKLSTDSRMKPRTARRPLNRAGVLKVEQPRTRSYFNMDPLLL